MASILYNDIFESFLGEITDYDIAALAESDADQQMTEWLNKAVHNMLIYDLFSSAELDDETQTFEYEMAVGWSENADAGFIKNLLGKAMAYEWISPKVNNIDLLHQFFGNSESKYYAQANQLAQLKDLKANLMTEIRDLVDNRGLLKNSYLEG